MQPSCMLYDLRDGCLLIFIINCWGQCRRKETLVVRFRNVPDRLNYYVLKCMRKKCSVKYYSVPFTFKLENVLCFSKYLIRFRISVVEYFGIVMV